MKQSKNSQRRLFIIGAPKCGTTSLAHWLSEHESVFMSPIKEPNYFCSDLPQRIRSWDSYSALFSDAKPEHIILAEASTRYIRSKVAVPTILKQFPDAQFIAMVRNPVDMAISLHRQFLYNMVEEIPEFERAWELQNERSKGSDIPRYCPDPRMLHYGDMCSIGTQLSTVFSWIHPERIKVIVLDDMRENPLKIWRDLCTFLEIDDKGRQDFPVLNAAKRHRSKQLARLLKWAGDAKNKLLPSSKSRGLLKPLMTANRAYYNNSHITAETRIMLQNYFYDDICLLSDILHRDFKAWLM